jgi:hypothetical protein
MLVVIRLLGGLVGCLFSEWFTGLFSVNRIV